MSESNAYGNLKKNLPEPKDRLDRVENFLVAGMPDINFCGEGRECWLELKSPVEPKRSTTPLFGSNHSVSQDQMNWFLRQSKAEGNAYMLIATDKRWLLIDGAHADKINQMSVAQLIEKASWATEKPIRRKEEWKKLRAVLVNSRPNPTSTS